MEEDDDSSIQLNGQDLSQEHEIPTRKMSMNDTDISINNSVVRDASDIQEMTRNTIDLDDK